MGGGGGEGGLMRGGQDETAGMSQQTHEGQAQTERLLAISVLLLGSGKGWEVGFEHAARAAKHWSRRAAMWAAGWGVELRAPCGSQTCGLSQPHSPI